MIIIEKIHFENLLSGHVILLRDHQGKPVNIKLSDSLVKPVNHVKKPLPKNLITRAGIIENNIQ